MEHKGQLCSVIKDCESNGKLPEKYCTWCLDDKPYLNPKGYPIWHYDCNGKRICRRCYLYMLSRERAIGMTRVKIYERIRTETRQVFKWLNMH